MMARLISTALLRPAASYVQSPCTRHDGMMLSNFLPPCHFPRNGPGTFTVDGDEVAHPFDGDGLVCSISIKDGRAYFRAKHVATRE
jgi:hypothetical protein